METQTSISAWAEATFGDAGSNLRVATRANEEMSELLRALSIDENHPEAGEEIADVVIILYQLASRMDVDLCRLSNEFNQEFPPQLSSMWLASSANISLSGMIFCFVLDDDSAEALHDLVNVFVILNALSHRLGLNLQEEVNKKMAVNRQRTWERDGSGHGYHHVKEVS